MQLVEVKRQEALCDSSLVAKKFNQQHKEVVKRIKYLIKTNQMPGEIDSEKRSYRGKEYDCYLLSASQVIRLMMQFTNKDIKKYISELLPQSMRLVDKIFLAIDEFDMDESLPGRYVYAASDSQGNIKIGISKDPQRRVKELNIGNPNDLKLVFIKEAVQDKYIEETEIHKKLNKHRLRGEWFYLPGFDNVNMMSALLTDDKSLCKKAYNYA